MFYKTVTKHGGQCGLFQNLGLSCREERSLQLHSFCHLTVQSYEVPGFLN